jgi:signal transduction histidine kinase
LTPPSPRTLLDMAGYLFAAACVVLLGACYRAGRAALPSRWTAAIAAGALCVPAAQFAFRPVGLASVTGFAAAYLVFAALPLLAGRYVAAQRMAVEHERLRERLGIAREMHDSLGRRLSLAAVQAAALEVSDLPGPQRAAVARLAVAIRASVTELHEILGVLRSERAQARGMHAVDGLIEEFRSAGTVVSAWSRGTPWPLRPPADETAYRVIEEGLTNAGRHAPGRPVSVTIAWEADMLLLTVVNPADGRAYTPGSGLADLAGQLEQAGGSLSHEVADGQFRLCAALPAAPVPETTRRPPVTALGLATGILLLMVLPAVILLGVH